MKKCYEDLSEYISTVIDIDDAGVSVFTNIIGAMSRENNEEKFDAYKDIAETAIVGLMGINLITEREQEDLIGLLDECSFEDNGSYIEMKNVDLDEASRILSGMILYDLSLLYNGEDEDEIIGKSFTFHTNEEDEISKFRTLAIHDDGKVLISEEY